MATKFSQEDWQALSDAETLAQYQEILGNPNRLKKAVNAAKKKALMLQTRAEFMNNASKTKRNKR